MKPAMLMSALRCRSLARAFAVCAVLALLTDLSDAHIHLEEDCQRCIMAEVDGVSERSATSSRPSFRHSGPAAAGVDAPSLASRYTHRPRAPPALS